METLGLLEKTMTFKHALLATKVAQVIKCLEQGAEIRENDYEILTRGTNLLRQIIEGSLLIEKKDAIRGFSPSQEGFFVYGKALSAIETLDLVRGESDFTELFINLHEKLESLSQRREPIETDTLPELKCFFYALSDLFGEDMRRDSFRAPLEHKTASQLNGLDHGAIA